MRDKLVPLTSAAIVVLLQIVVAPIIAIYSVVPNFIVAFVVVLSIVRREDTTYGYAFGLGLLSDLLSHTPLGLTPLLLLILSFLLSRAFELMDKENVAMVLTACFLSIFSYEFMVMVVQLIMGYPASFFDLFFARVLPATIFGFIISAILYFVARKFPVAPHGSDAWTLNDSQRFR